MTPKRSPAVPISSGETRRLIDDEHLRGQPGLSKAARLALVAEQPGTVLEALLIAGVGRKTTGRLLTLGLLEDPEGVQQRARTLEEMGLR